MATWLKPWETVRFTIVREPIERFVSVYKFVCKFRSDCPAKVKTIHDFARWLYKIQKAELKKGKAASRSTQFITWHSWPQTRYCNIENNRTTLVHHSSNRQKMRQEMMTVFRRARIPQRVGNKALRHLLRSSTAHASENRTEKRNLKKEVMENNRTMEYIKAIYHQDFHFFEKHKF
ncbi:unnamed protein product, partial [Mesorhabditis belari]|uniref:Carbohydrate sulfotransferase n=1 Tax=Mesorhabditis belari TaxID=2138241 RepID=A0AAF3ES78_9BILA